MAIAHTSRTGKTYYLHTGPKRGGGVQYFFSTKPTGSLAEQLPQGFETYESVHGQVFLRRKTAQLIADEEIARIESRLGKLRGRNLYKIEVRDKTLTIFESTAFGSSEALPWISKEDQAELRERFAYYQAVLRFTLVDAEKRLFAPERYYFSGMGGWIPLGRSDRIEKLAAKYVKHLGSDSFFELY